MSQPKTAPSAIMAAFKRVQRTQVFRFLSSVRMAVPLMLVILVSVAAGTLFESRYNAQVASLKVYRTIWFQGLLCLLWVNILFAAVSRIPFKVHHTGFVITHIGLLTLLGGAWITMHYGIDGQLRVVESQSGNEVVLSDPVLKVTRPESQTPLTYSVPRKLDPRSRDQLGLSDLTQMTGLRVDRYLPFVAPGRGYANDSAPMLARQEGAAGGVTLDFNLQSAFFNVNQTLSSDQPEAQMGPARLRLVSDGSGGAVQARQIPTHSDSGDGAGARSPHAMAEAAPEVESPAPETGAGTLVVKDAKTDAELGKLSLGELAHKPGQIRGVEIDLVRAYEEGVVSQNKLAEGGHPGKNPALELRVRSGSNSVREVAFANFPGFSLNEKGALGLRFVYQASAAGPVHGGPVNPHAGEPAQAASEPSSNDTGAGAGDRSGNVIEFHTLGSDSSQVRLELFKNGQQVLSKTVPVGQAVQTPWMGMKITVAAISGGGGGAPAAGAPRTSGGGDPQVTPMELQPKSPLPPSAVYVDSEDGDSNSGGWIIEGDTRVIQTRTGSYEVYYGPDRVNLPFSLQLDKFEKVDYPGTDTAMSFQSTIRVNGKGAPILISMNEPLKQDGYLIYQSSYEMGQGQQTASIFSVNKDPGRGIKYLGAMILIAGIAIFTVMRSKPFLNWQRRKVAMA